MYAGSYITEVDGKQHLRQGSSRKYRATNMPRGSEDGGAGTPHVTTAPRTTDFQARRPFGQLPSFGRDTPTHATPRTARSSTLSTFFRGGILTAAVTSFLLGLLSFLGIYVLSRGATPVQQAVVSVDATEHAYTPSAAANASAPLLKGGGFPADAADPVLIITKDDVADVSRDVSGAWNVSTQVGVVSADKNECPLCEGLFGMLRTSSHNGRFQDVHMQIRGEPKSGTSFMFEWAVNALMVTCSQLRQWYGSRACSIKWAKTGNRASVFKEITDGVSALDMKVVKLVFDMPRHGDMAAPCQCQNVDRVTISISHLYKHNMPVVADCPWQHIDGVTPESPGCTTSDMRPSQNHEDVAACVRASQCRINDNRLQMLVLRDPRAVVVSSYFYLKTHKPYTAEPKHPAHPAESVDLYALRMLPTICRFVHIRYLVLLERMADQTVAFMYEESLADPLEWHRRWLLSVGLDLPEAVVQRATDIALNGDYEFAAKGRDKHPGGVQTTPSRSYETEVGPEVRAQLDDICRRWLPPVLLEKFGVPPP